VPGAIAGVWAAFWGAFWDVTGKAWRAVAGLVYIYAWSKAAGVRYVAQRGAIALLAGALLFLGLEVSLELWGLEMATHTLGWLRIGFWVALVALLWSKIREWNERKQQFYFPQAAKQVAELLSHTRVDVASDDTLKKLLAVFAQTFAHKGGPNANIALLTSAAPDAKLRITYQYPEHANYNGAPEFSVDGDGEGGAGFCCVQNCMVYIPRASLRHGILQTLAESRPYKLVTWVFVERGPRLGFRSVLSVPLTAYGTCYGVLNFDSSRANAFSRVDFEQAMFYGVAVAQVLQIRRELGGEVFSRQAQ
jgi:hypothetical protein